MTDKVPSDLTAATTLGDTDLILVYPLADAVLKKMAASVLIARILTALGATVALVANNLSDLANATTARANLGLGTAAVQPVSAFYQVANNLSEVPSAATARTNLGAAPTVAPVITGGASIAGGMALTGGLTFSGSTKQNVQAAAALDLDLSVSDFFTKSISTNSAFTFSNATASKGEVVLLKLTISAAAHPTWPAAVKWEEGVAADPGDGEHLLGFITFDGGTSWTGMVGAFNVS